VERAARHDGMENAGKRDRETERDWTQRTAASVVNESSGWVSFSFRPSTKEPALARSSFSPLPSPSSRRPEGNESLPPLSRGSAREGERERARIGRTEGERDRESGLSRFAESEAYISAGTNCPIIHSVRRQRCSFAYPRPFLPPPRPLLRPPAPAGDGFCLTCFFRRIPESRIDSCRDCSISLLDEPRTGIPEVPATGLP